MGKRKKIGERISYRETDDKLEIDIVPGVPEQKVNMLMLWLVLWTFIGVSLFFYLFTQFDIDEQTQIGIIVLLGFWLYYEYRMIRAYRWLKYGKEELIFSGTELMYTTLIGKKGLPAKYDVNKMGKITGQTLDKKSFRYQMENSFWIIGSGRLFFKHGGSEIYFGKKLDEVNGKKLAAVMERYLSGVRE